MVSLGLDWEVKAMKQIEVDLDVFARIWACRKGTEKNENEVLRRMLLVDQSVPEGESLVEPNAMVNGRTNYKAKEVKSSDRALGIQGSCTSYGKVRWVDDVRTALVYLGGQARLAKIYEQVERIRAAEGRSIPRSLDATIRRTLEDHSSDSENFRAREDLFRIVERGIWALR